MSIQLTVMVMVMTRKFLLTLAIIGAILLPGVAVASTVTGYKMMADAASSVIPYGSEVEFLAGKNIAYWFLTLAAISILSWTWIVKWLIKQLEAQRDSNAKLVASLLETKEKENQELRNLLSRTVNALEHATSPKN